MSQENLFGESVPSQNSKVKSIDHRPMSPKDSPEAKQRCKNCVNFFTHQYSDRYKYCRIYKQNNTAYGCLKVKSNTPACVNFKLK